MGHRPQQKPLASELNGTGYLVTIHCSAGNPGFHMDDTNLDWSMQLQSKWNNNLSQCQSMGSIMNISVNIFKHLSISCL